MKILLLKLDEPLGYFLDARESFLIGDVEDAAHNIRKGAATNAVQIARVLVDEYL